MKFLLLTLAATAALANAGPASAHPDDENNGGYAQGSYYGQSDDWQNRDGGGYSAFQAQYAHDIDGIRHGLSDGSISRYQGSVYYRELQNIRQAAWDSEQRGGYDNGYIQHQLELLHARMHQAHERGHEQQHYSNYYDQNGYYYNR